MAKKSTRGKSSKAKSSSRSSSSRSSSGPSQAEAGKITHSFEPRTAVSEVTNRLNQKAAAMGRDLNRRASAARKSIVSTAQKARRGDKAAIAKIAAPTLIAAAAVGTSITALVKSRRNGKSSGRSGGRNGSKGSK